MSPVCRDTRPASHSDLTTTSIDRRMCEAESVEYLRDLIQEKDNLDSLEGHHIIKSLLNQGEIICN